MPETSPPAQLPRAQRLAERAFSTLERFLHIEAASGVVLLVAAVAALIWANSPWVAQYNDLWHTPVGMRFGTFEFS